MDWQVGLYIFIGIALVLGLIRNASQMLRQSERMLKDIDKSKLKKIDDDDWEE